MLVCPHCQFENPDSHRFCQRCGGSLTEKACFACGALVPLDIEYCPSCGNIAGTVWQAIFTLSDSILVGAAAGLDGEAVVTLGAAASGQSVESVQAVPPGFTPQDALASILTNGKFIDANERYQLLEPLAHFPLQDRELETRVLDCQPLQPSFLEALQSHQAMETDTPLLESDILQAATIPIHARPYLELQNLYPSLSLPQIHDAWEHNGISIILLEDRTELPSLVEFCQKQNIVTLQLLHWLREMADYWAILQPQYYCRSLLKLDNLKVDREDHILCLQRLYADDPSLPPSLRDLGNLWQTLFEQSQHTQNGELFLLCRDLQTEAILSIESLQSRIESIATTLQASGVELSASMSPSAAQAASSVHQRPITHLAVDSDYAEDLDEDVTDEGYLEIPDGNGELISEGDDLPTVVLPMRLTSLEDAGRTDIGRQRDHNEDCFFIQSDIRKLEGPQGRTVHAKGLYILCDGMGGHASGEVASTLAVETLRRYFETTWQERFPSEQSIREGIRLANQAIYDQNQQNSSFGSGRMGTTLLLVLLQDTKLAVAHVGDSRLYRVSRRRGLEQITVDHEVGQREIQRGVEPAIAYARPDAYQLTQALGPRDENFIHPDVSFLELNEDILLLLCSDGLTDNEMLESHWQSHLEPMLTMQTDLEQSLSDLVDHANQFNGHDNITTIAIRARVRPNLIQLNQRQRG